MLVQAIGSTSILINLLTSKLKQMKLWLRGGTISSESKSADKTHSFFIISPNLSSLSDIHLQSTHISVVNYFFQARYIDITVKRTNLGHMIIILLVLLVSSIYVLHQYIWHITVLHNRQQVQNKEPTEYVYVTQGQPKHLQTHVVWRFSAWNHNFSINMSPGTPGSLPGSPGWALLQWPQRYVTRPPMSSSPPVLQYVLFTTQVSGWVAFIRWDLAMY